MGYSRIPKSRPDFLITYHGNVATLDVSPPELELGQEFGKPMLAASAPMS